MSVQQARRLRKRATEAETRLWSRLRNRQIANLKFRRQHPLGNRIVDFFCQEAKLGIELDGSGQLKLLRANFRSRSGDRPVRKGDSRPTFSEHRRLQQSRWRFECNYLRSRS
jgi:uncharacterized membrane protein